MNKLITKVLTTYTLAQILYSNYYYKFRVKDNLLTYAGPIAGISKTSITRLGE